MVADCILQVYVVCLNIVRITVLASEVSFMLIQNDIMPLYQQLKELLRNSILNGEIKQGEKIPSEMYLSEKYNVSRITVRNALAELVQEGFLLKRQGKGTYVSRPKMERKIIEFLSFTLSCQVNGLRPGTKTIKKEIIEPEEEDIEGLDIDADDKIIHIQRVRYADDEPVMLENIYFSCKKYHFLLTDDTNNSVYEILRTKYNINPVRSTKVIEIVEALEEEIEYLSIPKGSPLFLLKAIAFDDNDVPVHRADHYIIGDRYKFIIP